MSFTVNRKTSSVYEGKKNVPVNDTHTIVLNADVGDAFDNSFGVIYKIDFIYKNTTVFTVWQNYNLTTSGVGTCIVSLDKKTVTIFMRLKDEYLRYGEEIEIFIDLDMDSGYKQTTFEFSTELEKPVEFFVVNNNEQLFSDNPHAFTSSGDFSKELIVKENSMKNISVNIENPKKGEVYTGDKQLSSFYIEKPGRLDTHLNQTTIQEQELGTAQIVYETKTKTEGSFSPPEFSPGSNEDAGFIRNIIPTEDGDESSINEVSFLNVCAIKNDYLFVTYFEEGSGVCFNFFVNQNDFSIGDIYEFSSYYFTDSFYDGEYYYAVGFSSTKDNVEMQVLKYFLDGDANLTSNKSRFSIKREDINADVEFIIGASIIKDGDTIFLAVNYKDSTNIRKILFMKSIDSQHWDIIYKQGSFETKSTFYDAVGAYTSGVKPLDEVWGLGYVSPAFYYDEIEDRIILTVTGVMDDGGTTSKASQSVAFECKNNMQTFNIIAFDGENKDYIKPCTKTVHTRICVDKYLNPAVTKMLRIRGRMTFTGLSAIRGQTDSYNHFQQSFVEDEETIYSRKWSSVFARYNIGAFSSVTKYGMQFTFISSHKTNASVATTDNMMMIVQGMLTNSKWTSEHYSHVIPFSLLDSPDETVFTKTVTGTPTELITPDGYKLTSDSSNYVSYHYDFVYTNLEFSEFIKFRFKMITHTALVTSNKNSFQGVRIEFDVGNGVDFCSFDIKVTEREIYFLDNNNLSNSHSEMVNSSVPRDIMIVVQKKGNNSSPLFMMYYLDNDETDILNENWIEFYPLHTLTTSTTGQQRITYGNITTPTSPVSFDWTIENLQFQEEEFYSNPSGIACSEIKRVKSAQNATTRMLSENVPQILYPGQIVSFSGLDGDDGQSFSLESKSHWEPKNVSNKDSDVPWRSSPERGSWLVMDMREEKARFDTIFLKNTNFLRIYIQGNSTNSWASPDYSLNVNMTFGDLNRTTQDSTGKQFLTIVDNNQSWEPGELVGKYLWFWVQPNVFGQSTAFKISENGRTSITFSCVKATGNSTVTLPSGQFYVLCDTEKTIMLDNIEEHNFIRLYVPSSIDDSQSVLPEECESPGYEFWKVGIFDFGIRQYLNDNYYFPKSIAFDPLLKITPYNGKLVSDRYNPGKNVRVFELGYNSLESSDWKKIKSIWKRAADRAQKFWYTPSPIADRKSYIVIVDGPITEKEVAPGIYDVKLRLREVK